MDKNYAQLSIDHADENNEQQMDLDEYGYTKDSNDKEHKEQEQQEQKDPNAVDLQITQMRLSLSEF